MAAEQTDTSPTGNVAPEVTKPIHTILLDTSPILLNTPSISTLLANSHELVTTQSVISEVKGEEARTRLETLYKPFLTVRSPKPESVKHVRDFARKTGDSGVLSETDLEILALAYDLECEQNGGDWRLRNAPGQKRLNGSPPAKEVASEIQYADGDAREDTEGDADESLVQGVSAVSLDDAHSGEIHDTDANEIVSGSIHPDDQISHHGADASKDEQDLQNSEVNVGSAQVENTTSDIPVIDPEEHGSSDSDDGWITPSNIKRHQAKDEAGSNTTRTETRVLQVATMTGDFAMQNVLLQMNLNLLSTKTCKRVAHIKQMILRCHGCFGTTKDMSKQFCPRCGKPTLTRVTCTTNDRGEVKLHLKANYQWNNRGNVFSIPKPVAGSANQKWKGARQGGGQGGWGSDLILAEDQKEYVRVMSSQKRTKKKDLMDEDVLPGIITGERDRSGGRVRVGAGRGINSRKR